MKKLVVFLTVCALSLMFTVGAYAANLSVLVSQDCFTRADGDSATTNQNMDPTDPTNKEKSIINLRYKSGKNRNVYLEFDVKGIQGATVDGATLTIASIKTGGNTTFDVYPVTETWDEKTVTWNTNPKYDESKKLGSYTSTADLLSGEQVVVTLDKSFIKGDGKYSVVLVPTGPSDNNDDSEFYTKENNASKAAVLSISYSETATTSPDKINTSENPKTGDTGIVIALASLLASAGAGYVFRKRKQE